MTISDIGQPTWYRPDNVLQVGMYLWNTGTLSWERATGGGGVGTDVTVLNFPATQVVSANNLDIRDLAFASDRVDASGSVVTISGSVAVTGAISFTVPQHVIVDSGAVTISGGVAVTGSVTANAGTNLNTSLLALEAGGNLAALVAKDFATQTTLAALNAKVVVVDTGNVTVAVMPTVTVQATNLDIRDLVFAADKVDASGSSVTAVVTNAGVFAAQVEATATAEPPEYTDAETSPLSQDLLGNLRTQVAAVVSDVSPSYIDGQIKPLSLNSDGRLRVSVVPAPDSIEFFLPFDFGGNRNIYGLSTSPWSALS